jgi:hypothetical protein
LSSFACSIDKSTTPAENARAFSVVSRVLRVLGYLYLVAREAVIRELFGPEQASLFTAEWIDELEFLNWPARPGVSDFRRITIAASARLAHRKRFQPA